MRWGTTRTGIHTALLSAILFGVSPVACKLLAGELSPALLAGLLYAGSGFGLGLAVLLMRIPVREIWYSMHLRQWVNLGGAIVAGGIAAPLFLAYGILNGSAAEVSLLLNFETVATTLMAWVVFHEHIGRRVWAGKFLIVFASVLLVIHGGEKVHLSLPGGAVVAACFLWGVDNNLTRELDTIPASLLGCVKGVVSGTFNLFLWFLYQTGYPTWMQATSALTIGAVSYGLSLILFIHSLRQIGSARTSTWFASGPFIGSLAAIFLLHEHPPAGYWPSALLMVSGMFFLYGESHRHMHRHDPLEHAHFHEHDEHHRHEHPDGGENPHEHLHIHQFLEHSHVHWPDIHHRHRH